jgi:hypothetical protein
MASRAARLNLGPLGGRMKACIWILAVALVTVSCTRREKQQDIVFARKAFFDSAQTTDDDYVYVAGTLTGEGVGYKNNTTAVVCYRERMECLTYHSCPN